MSFFSVVCFHLAEQDAVVVEGLARVFTELFEQVVHSHPAALLALDVEDDAARIHHQGAVAQLQCLVHVVGDHQAGDLLFRYNALGQFQHLFGGGGVQRGGVLVEQEPENGKYALTGTEVVLTVSSGYVNATVSVYFPQEERTVDLEVYVDGKKQAASDLGVSLTNLLMMDLQSFSFTTRVQKNSYKVDIRMSPSGTKQFQAYASYTVNGKTGEVTQNGTYTLPR